MSTEVDKDIKIIVRYASTDVLQSGWLIGEEKIAAKAAMISTNYGKGKIILIGGRVQNRAQTDGSYKLLFNTFYGYNNNESTSKNI